MGTIGTQSEYARIPLADGTLVATPGMPADDLVPSLLAASDVLGTGWFAAVAAEAGPGKTVAVVGDGAVGLLGILAARELGAERIIAMSRHADRQELAREFGATDIVEERGDDGVARIKELTDGLGAHSVIEAVGTQESMMQAIRVHPPRRPRRLRRRLPRRRAARRRAVLLPGPPARRPRPRAPLPARPHRPHLDRQIDPARSSTSTLPLDEAADGLHRHGRAARHQDPPHRLTDAYADLMPHLRNRITSPPARIDSTCGSSRLPHPWPAPAPAASGWALPVSR